MSNVFKVGDLVILTQKAQIAYKEGGKGWRQDCLDKPFTVAVVHSNGSGNWVSGPVRGWTGEQAAWNHDLELFTPLSVEEQVITKVKQLWTRQPYYKDHVQV